LIGQTQPFLFNILAPVLCLSDTSFSLVEAQTQEEELAQGKGKKKDLCALVCSSAYASVKAVVLAKTIFHIHCQFFLPRFVSIIILNLAW